MEGGLEETISPARAWEVMRSGIECFSDAAIQNHLRTFAIVLVKHKQLGAIFVGGGLDDEDVLLQLVCHVHGARPEPGAILSIERFAAAPCRALAKWDSVYYALIAQVRSQYNIASTTDNAKILHTSGSTGDATNQAFTVDDLLILLRNIWGFLVDPRLLGPLEVAVRYQALGESFRNGQIDHEFGQTLQQAWQGYTTREKEALIDSAAGMLDVARMSVGTIERGVRRYCIEIRRAGLEEQTEPAPRAEHEEDLPASDSSHQPQPESPPPPPPTDESPCCCFPGCVCQLVCQYGIHECQCKTAREVQSAPGPISSSPPPRRPVRVRTNTAGSQALHGVYQSARRHKGKQAFPTEFYADHRGSGRYPRFAPSSTEPSSSPPASSGAGPPPPRDEILPRATTVRPSFSSGRRLVPAGGDLPLSEREVFPDDHLPQPEERGWAMTKEEFEALPTPRRPSDAVEVGEAGPSRRPSWVKRVFSRSNSYTR